MRRLSAWIALGLAAQKKSKKWTKWKRDTARLSGTFGRKRKPVKVKGGRRYKFQARSRDGKGRSEWSPTLVVQR
jgi:hypothetical protein